MLDVFVQNALHRISDEIKSNPGTDYIIDGHTAFWWKNGPISLLSVDDFKELRPDLFITVISTARELDDTLLRRKEWRDSEIDMYELLLWSELEIYTADLISKIIGKENYIIGINEDPITLYNLIYNRKMLKIYSSFSMEHRKGGYAPVSRFVKKLRKFAIVFDPRSVDLSAYAKFKKDKRIMKIARKPDCTQGLPHDRPGRHGGDTYVGIGLFERRRQRENACAQHWQEGAPLFPLRQVQPVHSVFRR